MKTIQNSKVIAESMKEADNFFEELLSINGLIMLLPRSHGVHISEDSLSFPGAACMASLVILGPAIQHADSA